MSVFSKWLKKRTGIPETRLMSRADLEKKVDAFKPRFFSMCEDYDVNTSTALVLWVTLRKFVLDLAD